MDFSLWFLQIVYDINVSNLQSARSDQFLAYSELLLEMACFHMHRTNEIDFGSWLGKEIWKES